MKPGKVYLVGAGPGDAGLITVKGLGCLKMAEVVVYDYLLDKSLLEAAPAEAEKIYAGKKAGCHALKQGEINQLLVDKVRDGKIVVRLKGGDPFVLGRGGEEAEVLAENSLPFEIVPGITSSIAAPAYAGIPLTHRTLASSFSVITGHEDPTKGKTSINWERLAIATDTLVFLMGTTNLPNIVEKLLENGRPADTPTAVIRNGTRPDQQTITGTLANIVQKAKEADIKPPAITVVGEVVKMRQIIAWFDNKPLFGRRVLVTRSRSQASALSRLVTESGALPVEMPAIKIQKIDDTTEFDKSIKNIDTYNWCIFTSANGVDAFFDRLHALGGDSRWLKGVKIAAIGAATAEVLETHGIMAEFIPQDFTSDGLLEGFGSQPIKGQRFLLPRADIASPELTDGLRQLGTKVDEIIAYKSIPAYDSIARGKKLLEEDGIDVITFTSSSTVTNLVQALGGDTGLINKATVACIGPVTVQTAREAGLKVAVTAREHTILGLVDALEEYYKEKRED
jgi:uroporphyrinogen III methyltransferase/synthase